MHAQMAETRPFLLLLFGPGNEAKYKAIPKYISSVLFVLLLMCSICKVADAANEWYFFQYSMHTYM